MKIRNTIVTVLVLLTVSVGSALRASAQVQYGINDTLLTGAVVYEGDTIPAQVLPVVFVWQRGKHSRKWSRLRNAVYVTYPYARKAGA
ncbi:MAG TPA: hypothetical protein PL128_10655, partial [Ginsengibacter sp.]|nr:hypothetical protein [Ginsengibacter sp.]